MKFDDECKVIVETMNKQEAEAFIKFLASEIFRHQMDIGNASKLIDLVKEQFELE